MSSFPLATLVLLTLSAPAVAQTGITAALLDGYRVEARRLDPGFQAFSAQRGKDFFHARHGDLSCASCHTPDPKAQGKHHKTGKRIEPLAPAANQERLGDPAKVEKWFKRNCNDVLQRACTAREKGDFITWLADLR